MDIQTNDRWAQMGIGVIPTRQDLPSKWKQPQGCYVAHNSPDLVPWRTDRFADAVFANHEEISCRWIGPSIERTQTNSGFNLLLIKIFYDPSLQFLTPVDWVRR